MFAQKHLARTTKVALLVLFLILTTNHASSSADSGTCAQLMFEPNLDRFPLIIPLQKNELWDSFIFNPGSGVELMNNWPNNWNARFVRIWGPVVLDWDNDFGPPPDTFGFGPRKMLMDVDDWQFDTSCATIANSAGLVAQGHDVTVNPGQSIRIWHNVRNTGLNTWPAGDGYGWQGIKDWGHRSGLLWRDVAPGETFSFTEDIIAPDEPGRYYYGFVLNQSGSNFGPLFFTRVVVRRYRELQVLAGTAWSSTCTGSLSACLPIKLSIADLPEQWQTSAIAAAATWSLVGTKLRILPQHIPDESRILIPIGPTDCNYNRPFIEKETAKELRLAIGEVRIVPMSRLETLYACSSLAGVGIPYAHPDNPDSPVAGLIVMNDQLPPWVHWRWRIPFYPGGGIDLQTIMTHEIGHTLGICGHDVKSGCTVAADTSSDAIMHSYDKSQQELILGGVPRKEIHADDISLLTQLYGEITPGGLPAMTSLISPSWLMPFGASNASTANTSEIPIFTWQDTHDNAQYLFQLSDAKGFENLLVSTTTSQNELVVPSIATTSALIEPFQTYFWRVQTTNANGNSEWSIPWELRISTQSCGMPNDATCDGQVSLADFEVWRQEYLGLLLTRRADFDENGTVDLNDYMLWRNSYDSSAAFFIPKPNQLARPATASFGVSQLVAQGDKLTDAAIFLETESDAKVSTASIGLRFPVDLLQNIDFLPCSSLSTASSLTSDMPSVTKIGTDQAGYEILRIDGSPRTSTGDLPAGRFCFVKIQFQPRSNLFYPLAAELTLDLDTSWEIVGEQTDFYPVPSTTYSRLEVTAQPSAFEPFISGTHTDLPECVLRQSPSASARRLYVDGQNMLSAPYHLQFRRADTLEESIHFAYEVSWESDARASVDFADIVRFLWSDDALKLQVRITSQDYEPVSNWSSSFWLASDEYFCPEASSIDPTPRILMPFLVRPRT